jgi:hypothetical protein
MIREKEKAEKQATPAPALAPAPAAVPAPVGEEKELAVEEAKDAKEVDWQAAV